MKKKIYLSGMHSGQNPASGLGIARCIRRAFPELKLVGVDHWQGSSGLHDSLIDEVFLLPQWSQISDEVHVAAIRKLLDDGHLWIAAMDMEVHWLSDKLGSHPNLLAPSARVLELTAKPSVKALAGLDFRVPEFIGAAEPDTDLHAFLRYSGWQCWLKSPYHDAKRISSWSAFERSRDSMAKDWRTSRLFLQRHVTGIEETIAFAAYDGKLLACAHLEKKQATPEGKTWSGRISPLDDALFEQLCEIMQRLGYSGGGEIEFVRDPDGQKWIIECNPRFPAWIFGGALAGRNLPGRLVSHVWNLPMLESRPRYPYFTRVVQEIPAKESVGIPLPEDATSHVWSADGKYGKTGRSFSAALPKIHETGGADAIDAYVPPAMLDEIGRAAASFDGESPARVHLETWTRSRFHGFAERVRACLSRAPELRVGYSVKTSPTDDFLRKAIDFGFLAECISQKEIHRALDFGFKPEQIILNGPGKFWPMEIPPVTGLHMSFCDSVEEFERAIAIPNLAKCLGFRIQLPSLDSRFGNGLSEFKDFERLLHAVRSLGRKAELGFHFHMPSWSIGVQRWFEALDSLLLWCKSVEALTGITVRRLDLGGGFFPSDLDRLDLAELQSRVRAALPGVRALYLEPGRALTQESEALVSRVLDVRRTCEKELVSVVVDASIAELPLARAYPHRVFHLAQSGDGGKQCARLEKGQTRILGRICMEDDILAAHLKFPETVDIGDLVIFGDAGGYERTMSYGFGRG